MQNSATSYSLAPSAQSGLCASTDPAVFTDFYNASINLCVWQRHLDTALLNYSEYLLTQYEHNTEVRVSALLDVLSQELSERLPAHRDKQAFIEDVHLLADMFGCLMGAQAIGLRLCTADKATCPRFHVDKLGCRLITTYQGKATEWLESNGLNRAKLGLGANGLPDSESGLYSGDNAIQKITSGDVALLKGELWHDNEGNGIVHRSPPLTESECRLFLTMDAIT